MEHPLLIDYGPVPGWIILIILGSISSSFFLFQLNKAIRLVMLGSPDAVSYTHLTLPTILLV